jgi:hypothetical protein
MVRLVERASQIVVHIMRPNSLLKWQVGHIRRELKDRVARIPGVAGLIVPAFGQPGGDCSFKPSSPD